MEPNLIDVSVEKILVQFSFSNRKRIPAWIPEDARETAEERYVRKHGRVPGAEFIKRTERIAVHCLPKILRSAGFTLVDAFVKPRRDAHKPAKTYYMVRFEFRREYLADTTPEWRSLLEGNISEALEKFCNDCWRVRAYKNNLYADEAIEGKYAMSINLEVCAGQLPEDKWYGELYMEDSRLWY